MEVPQCVAHTLLMVRELQLCPYYRVILKILLQSCLDWIKIPPSQKTLLQ